MELKRLEEKRILRMEFYCVEFFMTIKNAHLKNGQDEFI